MSRFVTTSFVCGKCGLTKPDKVLEGLGVWCCLRKQYVASNRPFCPSFTSANLLVNFIESDVQSKVVPKPVLS